MGHRPDSERIFAARKAATIERLDGVGIPRADLRWVESYDGGAAGLHDLRRDPAFCDNAYQYATREHAAGHRPPPPPDTSSEERDPIV
ncbi:MAG: hypothetical protein H0V73_08120 [Chloroflexi bacterium]|nr:hypothetical protein [Chloroflexota bacterium]